LRFTRKDVQRRHDRSKVLKIDENLHFWLEFALGDRSEQKEFVTFWRRASR
jgi:hypothetical protein